MALAETIYRPRFKGLTIGEMTVTGSFLLSTIGCGWLFINDHQVREEANILFPAIASEEEVSRAKVTTSLLEGQMWDHIDLGENTIAVPASIREARSLLRASSAREAERQTYITSHTIQHIGDFTPVPENISYAMLISGLVGIFLSAPFLPKRWRTILYH